jgi:hypothetical protein
VRRFLTLALVLLALPCATWSCVHDVAYRSSATGCGTAGHLPCSVLTENLLPEHFHPRPTRLVNPANLDESFGYRLAFIEFDDKGQFHDPEQKDKRGNVTDPGELALALKAIADTKAEAVASGKQAVVALFVHGWKNNASDGSGNVWGFRQTLAGLAQQFGSPLSRTQGRVNVVGIYIGWRGSITNVPVVENFTFFDRHAKAQSLATSLESPMVSALVQIMDAANKKVDGEPKPALSVLIGHSFGGAVLETAVTYQFNHLISQLPDGQPLAPPATLIMFLNEAQEAQRSYPLLASLNARLKQNHCNAINSPLILSISSTGDIATRVLLPFGRLIERPFNRPMPLPANNPLGYSSPVPLYYHATAHLTDFQSHLLISESLGVRQQMTADTGAAPPSCSNELIATLTSLTGQPTEYQIVSRLGSKNDSPFWVMQMPTSLVPDHSTIFTPAFREFLISLLLRTQL